MKNNNTSTVSMDIIKKLVESLPKTLNEANLIQYDLGMSG